MNEIVKIETTRSPMMAGGRPSAIVPQSMEDCYRLAVAICKAQMAPKGLDTPEKAMVAIMHGLEIGLTPMTALQRIAVVNGRPTIWGDGAVSLVRGSGVCEWIKEKITGEGEAMVASCETKRRGEPEPISRAFSVSDAKKAGLWGKQGPWQQFPARMLAMRARAFCLRDGFADVLGGLYLKEEIDNGETEQATPMRRAPAPAEIAHHHELALAQLEAPRQRRAPPPPAPAPEPVALEATAEDAYDFEDVRKRYTEAAKAAKDGDELEAIWQEIVEPHYDGFSEEKGDSLLQAHRRRTAELEP